MAVAMNHTKLTTTNVDINTSIPYTNNCYISISIYFLNPGKRRYFGRVVKAGDLRSPGATRVSSILTGTKFLFFFMKPRLDPFNAFTFIAKGRGDAAGTSLKVAVKDNIAVKGWPLTCASGYLKGKLV